MTALDVTGPGPYTGTAPSRPAGPIPLWNRGNPDTRTALASGATDNGSAADRAAYSAMGETWSHARRSPIVTSPTNPNAVYNTTRRPDGVDYVLFMGSGYGGTGEGTTFYTLDALSGDVIAAVDVEIAAAAYGLDRPSLPYPNALVANAVGFNPAVFSLLPDRPPGGVGTRPASTSATSTAGCGSSSPRSPDVAIPVADLGADQPIGTAASLLGVPPDARRPGALHLRVVGQRPAGRRAPSGTSRFRDDGTDTDTTTIGAGAPPTA